jgi:RNA polymerase sigma-70 factor (ECF subfamily)
MTGSERRDAIEPGRQAADGVPSQPQAADWITVERARRHDLQAFETLYSQHVDRIHALCLRSCGDATRAEDLVQEVFVRAWERIGTFAGRAQFSTWLYRLAVNRITDVLRSEIRRSQLERAEDAARDALLARRTIEPEARMDLENAIRALPAGARLVFVLHDVEGHGHEAIAEMTDIAVGTSKSQLYRARRLLREMLSR